jgi:hypothetical protein
VAAGEELSFSKLVACASFGLLVVGCDTQSADLAHEEMLRLRGEIRQGMKPADIAAAFAHVNPQHLNPPKVSPSVVVISQSVPEGLAKEWVLWVSLRQGEVAAVRIRTNDSPGELPAGAPADIVWSDEDRETPFSRERVSEYVR